MAGTGTASAQREARLGTGTCSACYNLLLRALGGDGGSAPSCLRAFIPVDGGPVPLGPTAAHEPTPIARGAWARWRSLGATSDHKLMRMSA